MRAAVLGRPIAHSLSPLLHRAAYVALGLTDWTYDALDVGADELPELIVGLGPEWRGFSVTMPCKQAAVEVADVVQPLPRMLRAANTLVRFDGGWRAENTDVMGIGMALQVAEVENAPRAVILGAGGTAAAAAVALASLGAEHIEVVVREPSRAADLVRLLDGLEVATTVSGFGSSTVDAPLIVSSVPLGGQLAAVELPWRAEHTVLDVLYDPWPTPLARRVREAGGRVVAGSEVLFWQATAQVELMTGQVAPLEAMRRALVAALDRS